MFDETPDENGQILLDVRIKAELYHALHDLAEKAGMSYQDFVVKILSDYLAEHYPKD